MKVSSEIFDLIKSLGKQEKRYFKLFMDMNGGNRNKNLVDLFDAIDKLNEYDEAKLKKKFKDRKFVNQLHVTKNRLYNKILKSLNFYYSENTVEDTIKSLMQQAEILMDRTLYDQGKKRLDKALKLAKENEYSFYIVQIYMTNLRYFGGRHNLVELKSQHVQLESMSAHLFSQYRNYMNLNMLRSKITEIMSERDLEKISNFLTEEEHELLTRDSESLSFREREQQYLISSVYYRLLRNNDLSYKYRLKLVKLIEDNFEKIKGQAKTYITALFNLLVIQMEKRFDDEALTTLEKLKSLRKSKNFKLTEDRLLNLNTRIITGELVIRSNKNDYGYLSSQTPDYLAFINVYGDKISVYHYLIILHFVAATYFVCEKFTEASTIFYQILNHKNIEVRADIQSYAVVLNMLCFYEIGNVNLLDSTVKSTYRFFQKKEKIQKVEDEIIKLIRKASNQIKGSTENLQLFKKYLVKFEELKNDNTEASIMNGLFIIQYLKSKIENKSIIEVLKDNE